MPQTPRIPQTISAGNAQDAADQLENTLAQLRSLLWICHGEEIDWTRGTAAKHLDNLLWLAAELADKADALFQQSAAERREAPAIAPPHDTPHDTPTTTT